MDTQTQLAHIIDHFGWAIQVVEPQDDCPRFAYTIGLSGRKIPELVVFGRMPKHTMTLILKSVADMFLISGEAICGDMYQTIAALPVRLREVDVSAFTNYAELAEPWATQHLHCITRAVQVVLPDRQGRFPLSDPNYSGTSIPLLPETD